MDDWQDIFGKLCGDSGPDYGSLSDNKLWQLHRESMLSAMNLVDENRKSGEKALERANGAKEALIKRGLWKESA